MTSVSVMTSSSRKIGTDGNHIHLLTSFPPQYSGSAVVRIFKSITARQLFKRFPALKQELWGGEFWSDGFYSTTYPSDVPYSIWNRDEYEKYFN